MLIILKSLSVGLFFDPNLDDNSAYPDYIYEMLQGDSSGATHTTSILKGSKQKIRCGMYDKYHVVQYMTIKHMLSTRGQIA